MRHKWKVGVLGIGAAVSLLLGSGMFSLTQDTVASPGNSVESGTIAVEGAHDIRAAKVGINGCPDAKDYSDGPIPAAISTPAGTPNVDLNGGWAFEQPDDFCVKNFGTQNVRVFVSFQEIEGGEVGVCPESESGEGEDSDCAPGDVGELSSLLQVRFHPSAGTSDSCGPSGSGPEPFDNYDGGVRVIETDLAPGEVCSVYLTLSIDEDATSSQLAAAQTERIAWTIYFYGVDTV